MTHLLIRADANTMMGTGHIMRCLALAQAWQAHGHSVTFISHQLLPDALRQRLESEGITLILHNLALGSVEDALHTIRLVQDDQALLVVDGYHFDSAYQKILFDAGIEFLFIDDNADLGPYYARWIVNQNSYAERSLYPEVQPDTELLLGSPYALIRKEFHQWRDWQRTIPPKAQQLIMTLGGSDADNVTMKCIQALESFSDDLHITVILGGSNPHYDTIMAYVERHHLPIQLKRNVSDMAQQIVEADCAITAGGSTNWEMCLLGLPCVMIILAQNQVATARDLDQRGVAKNLGWHQQVTFKAIQDTLHKLIHDQALRQSMSRKGQLLVDGHGSERITDKLIQSVRQA
ncbi:UDP-2,4-diacetamido-2,4,6-trideoxy-beta-L-altropyranose hydrolase [Anaerolineales bacterium]